MRKYLPAVLLTCCVMSSAVIAEEIPPWPVLVEAEDSGPLPGTKSLQMRGDLSLQLAEGCDRFLDKQIEKVSQQRPAADPNKLQSLLGMDRDQPAQNSRFQYYRWEAERWDESETLSIQRVRWQAFDRVYGEGLLLTPRGNEKAVLADVIAIPDAGQTPEEIVGLLKCEHPYAWQLAKSGCRVLVPMLIDRAENQHKMTNREWLHRPAFIQGRTLLGYELHKILTGVMCLQASQNSESIPMGVYGWGEGGLLALYAGAIDEEIDVTGASGYFGNRQQLWNEPAEHNIFGLLKYFGDAEIASLIAPRELIIGTLPPPQFVFAPDDKGNPRRVREHSVLNGKPGIFLAPDPESEAKRIADTVQMKLTKQPVDDFFEALTGNQAVSIANEPPIATQNRETLQKLIAERHAGQMEEIRNHNQLLLINAAAERKDYFRDLDTSSLELFQKTIDPYREKFRREVMGEFDEKRLPFNARTRKYQEGPKTVSYEVVLDVFDDVIAYGILTLPKDLDIESGEKRPVVVCQHGLEGTPQDVIGEAKYGAYKAFATRLAERGFITFAPQNNYKYFDLFRIQQFKAQSIGCTLFSLIVPSHQQITDWLSQQSFADPEQIAFYGLSYGGKSAMRIPPLVDNYCLSICSADFNEWVWKNAATDPGSLRYSYASKGEYEIFEWNLGGTFNYAEMATLIAPRPFMVERGHFDGVAPDETVAYEFAKVRHLYEAKLGLENRCEIEWFVGPHSINGEGTYRFLHKHLNWRE